MAGLLKPTGVSKEATWTVNAVLAPYNTNHNNALFDGIQGADYGSNNAWYWYDASFYIDITFNSKVNIWSYPIADGSSWISYYGNGQYGAGTNLKVEKWNGSSWDIVTSTVAQNPNHNAQWVKIFPELPAGRYRFKLGNNARMEGEWFVEKVVVNKYLFKDGADIKKYTIGTDVTPTMTSNTAPAPYVVNASGYANTWYPWKAFSKVNGVDDCWLVEPFVNPAWISINLGQSVAIEKYSIKARSNGGGPPEAWQLQGSADNATWMTIDSRTGITAWTAGEVKTFTLSSLASYRYYRLYITAGGYYVAIDELQLISPSGWSIVGTAPATKSMFDANGMTDILTINNDVIQVLTSTTPELLHWTDEVDVPASTSTVNAVPTLTSNTSDANITVFESSAYAGNYFGWRMFDRKDDLNGWLPSTVSNEYVGVQYSTKKIIGKYSLKHTIFPAEANRCPKDWFFEGSDDGLTWTILNTVTGQINWGASEKRTFTISSPQSFFRYRIRISANNGATLIEIGEMELFETTPAVTITRTVSKTALPNNKLVKPLQNFSSVEGLKNFSLTATQSGASAIRIIASSDDGLTWKSYKTGAWQTVDTSVLSNVKTNGMTISELNAVTETQLSQLITNNKLRLAYYLDQSLSTESVKIDSLSLTLMQYTKTPSVNSLDLLYKVIDSDYYGLIFSDTDGNYYSTSLGEVLQYLDFGTIIASQTSLETKVILNNFLNFPVSNIVLNVVENISNVSIELSKTNAPFIAETSLAFPASVPKEGTIEFYVRVVSTRNATAGGNFDITVKADPA